MTVKIVREAVRLIRSAGGKNITVDRGTHNIVRFTGPRGPGSVCLHKSNNSKAYIDDLRSSIRRSGLRVP